MGEGVGVFTGEASLSDEGCSSLNGYDDIGRILIEAFIGAKNGNGTEVTIPKGRVSRVVVVIGDGSWDWRDGVLVLMDGTCRGHIGGALVWELRMGIEMESGVAAFFDADRWGRDGSLHLVSPREVFLR